MEFPLAKRVILTIDLAGSAKAFQTQGDVKMAAVFHQFYTDCEAVITSKGGTIIKFRGDACLATFAPDDAGRAIEAVLELQRRVTALAAGHQVAIELGANVHLAPVIESEFGAGASRTKDIVGRGVNQTFLLGRGSGIRISEPVYRALPSNMRSPWRKHKPPAVYRLDESSDGLYEGLGKDANTNAQRW